MIVRWTAGFAALGGATLAMVVFASAATADTVTGQGTLSGDRYRGGVPSAGGSNFAAGVQVNRDPAVGITQVRAAARITKLSKAAAVQVDRVALGTSTVAVSVNARAANSGTAATALSYTTWRSVTPRTCTAYRVRAYFSIRWSDGALSKFSVLSSLTTVCGPTNQVRFDGIGPATLQWNAAYLTSIGYVNEGNAYEGASASCVRYAKAGNGLSFSVERATGRVLAIRNFAGDPTLRTQIGNIGGGSTLADIRRAFRGYRLIERFQHDFGQTSDGVIVASTAGEISFTLDGQTPDAFSSGAAKVSYLVGVGRPGNAPTNVETGC